MSENLPNLRKIEFAPDEVILAELIPTRRSVFFPLLELLLITGVIWFGIGALDHYLDQVAVQQLGRTLPHPTDVMEQVSDQVGEMAVWARRGLLLLWVWLAWRRCIRHLVFRARSRVVLTDHRLITATGHIRSYISQVPLQHIVDARSRGSDVAVYVIGTRHPMMLRDVPYAKRFTRLIRSQVEPL